MKLSVFQEFMSADVLKSVTEKAGVEVDQAAAPSPLVKEDAEKEMVARNAKLFFEDTTADEEVDAVLAKLKDIGFEVVHRNPITSAGCPMRDRVILKYTA